MVSLLLSLQGYLFPALGRPNLTVLTEAYVTRVVTSEKEHGLAVTGVEFKHGGETHVVHVGKEAILSAGSDLLQMSWKACGLTVFVFAQHGQVAAYSRAQRDRQSRNPREIGNSCAA